MGFISSPARASTSSSGPLAPEPAPSRFVVPTPTIAVFAAACIAAYLVTHYLFQMAAPRSRWFLMAALFIGGAPLLVDLAKRALNREFGSDLLAALSIVTSAILGEYLAGSIVVLMLSGGAALEQFATRRALSVLGALARRMPRLAHCKQGDHLTDIDASEIQVGERLVVFPHEICPADGLVLEGHGSMDESYLTGEPFLISKAPGARVLSGDLNGEMVLTISVSAAPADSRYTKIPLLLAIPIAIIGAISVAAS